MISFQFYGAGCGPVGCVCAWAWVWAWARPWAIIGLLISDVAAATEDHQIRSVAVAAGGTLTVNADFGAIEVVGSDRSDVWLEVWRRVRGKTEKIEQDFLAERSIMVEVDGESVRVVATKPGAKGWDTHSGIREATGKYVVKVPLKFGLKLETAGGGIQISNVVGAIHAQTSGGPLKFRALVGSVHGRTSGGGIQVGDCQGDLALDTSGGAIELLGGGGTLSAETAGGGITVRRFDGSAQVETSGGGLTLEWIGGALAGKTSGGPIHAILPQPIPGPVQLETTGGTITVRVSPQAVFDLDARTSGGRCSSELPLTRRTSDPQDHGVLIGGVGNQGPILRLRGDGGGIRLRRLDPGP